MNVYTKNELASVKRKSSLLTSAGYFIVNIQKQASNFPSKTK